MGSASSRMSASPALGHSVGESDASTVSTSTSTVSTSTSTNRESPTSILETRSQPERPSTPPITPPISLMQLDKGKGKEVVDDKEEGEISDNETIPIHHAKPPPVSSTKRLSSDRPAYDSYRPQQLRPRGASQSNYTPQYPRPNHSTQPRQRMHHSQSPLQMQFPQSSYAGQFPQETHYGQNGQVYQYHESRLSNGSSGHSSISPKTIEAVPNIHSSNQDKPISTTESNMTSQTPPASTLTQSPPEGSLALPSSLTTEEADQYMDIIRKLMLEGVRPDSLIKRGATPKYVSMVCREIVEGSRKKNDGLSETDTREFAPIPTPHLEENARTLPSSLEPPSVGSVDLVRDPSASSISSVDTINNIERMILPEQPTRLIPTSSWAPPPQKLPTSPVRIESYRPGRPTASSSSTIQPAQSSVLSTLGSSSTAPLGPRLGPGGIPRPVITKNSLRARASDLSPVVKRPGFLADNGPSVTGTTGGISTAQHQVEPHGPQPHVALTPVAHGAHDILAALKDVQPARPTAAIPRPISAPSFVTVLPVASTSTIPPLKASSAKNALLESKRRAMESMKRARQASRDAPRIETRPLTPPLDTRNSPLPMLPPSPPPILTSTTVVPLTQENLEDQVAALEQEVQGLREAEPMIEDEEEEGEILDEPVPPVQPRMAPIIPASTPIRLNKRPNAEDMMDNRSQSVSSRSVHPAKRRQFGTAIRMKRLIISLDESDDEDSGDEAPTPTTAAIEADRQRLLKEKDDNIMRLREQILRLQARAKKDKKDKTKAVPLVVPPVLAGETTSAGMTAVVEDIVMTESESALVAPVLAATIPIVDDVIPDTQVSSAIGEQANGNSMTVDSEIEEDRTIMPTPPLSSSSTRSGDTTNPLLMFEVYRPILDRYPQLVSSSIIKSSLPQSLWLQPNQPRFDPSRLSSIILTRRTQLDPNVVLCGAEAAGGSCADPTCSDLHLSRDLDRPHEDQEMVEYLSEIFAQVKEATLEKVLIEAKAALGISNLPSSKSKKKKNTELSRTETTYSMSIAEQLVKTVDELLQDQSMSSSEVV